MLLHSEVRLTHMTNVFPKVAILSKLSSYNDNYFEVWFSYIEPYESTVAISNKSLLAIPPKMVNRRGYNNIMRL